MENTPEFRRLGWHRPAGSSAVLTFQLPTISCVDGEAGTVSMTVCALGSNFQFDVFAPSTETLRGPLSIPKNSIFRALHRGLQVPCGLEKIRRTESGRASQVN